MNTSAMAKVYYRKIIRDDGYTLSQVPNRYGWQDEVKSMLNEDLADGVITQEQYDRFTQ